MSGDELEELRHLEAVTESLLRTIRGMIASRQKRPRRGLYAVGFLPVAGAVELARRWPRISAAVAGAAVSAGAMAAVLVPQVSDSLDIPPSPPPIAAPPATSPPAHTPKPKASPPPPTAPPKGPPSRRRPASTAPIDALPSLPLPSGAPTTPVVVPPVGTEPVEMPRCELKAVPPKVKLTCWRRG